METMFVSIVTAPLRANARPHGIVALVFIVMLVRARILPWKAVLVPRVAELATCQNRLSPWPPLVKTTEELVAVVKVLPI